MDPKGVRVAELMARCVRESLEAELRGTRPGRAARVAALRAELAEIESGVSR
jgi:hypothetical protein